MCLQCSVRKRFSILPPLKCSHQGWEFNLQAHAQQEIIIATKITLAKLIIQTRELHKSRPARGQPPKNKPTWAMQYLQEQHKISATFHLTIFFYLGHYRWRCNMYLKYPYMFEKWQMIKWITNNGHTWFDWSAYHIALSDSDSNQAAFLVSICK